MKKLSIYGEASKKIIRDFDLTSVDCTQIVLDFLISHNIPVASSCGGEGVCLKCFVTLNGQKLLSCQITLEDLFENSSTATLTFSYL